MTDRITAPIQLVDLIVDHSVSIRRDHLFQGTPKLIPIMCCFSLLDKISVAAADGCLLPTEHHLIYKGVGFVVCRREDAHNATKRLRDVILGRKKRQIPPT